jgi:hypothetical protein
MNRRAGVLGHLDYAEAGAGDVGFGTVILKV